MPVRCRTRGALLPHHFTLATHSEEPFGGIFLLHFPSTRAAQALPGTVPCGARTFLGILSNDATAWPTPPARIVAASARAWARGAKAGMNGIAGPDRTAADPPLSTILRSPISQFETKQRLVDNS